MNIRDLGWDADYASSFAGFAAQGLRPARVIIRNRDLYWLIGSVGEFTARLAGKTRHSQSSGGSSAVVGDWVAVQEQDGFYGSMIRAVLPRRTSFSRKAAGSRTDEQVIAANIDTVFIMAGLDSNFSLRRLERYLAVARGSKATPVVLLNKADLCVNAEDLRNRTAAIAPDIEVLCISAVTGQGLGKITRYMETGKTLVFLGSSGVGKSTLVNALFGEDRQSTNTTSSHNGKGRHTTTCAELIRHESGCLLLDTPGLRELMPWCDTNDVDASFADVMNLTSRCRFHDCRHQNEPGCAVREALTTGQLTAGRFASFQKIQREVRGLGLRKMQKEEHLTRLHKHEKLRGLKEYDRESS